MAILKMKRLSLAVAREEKQSLLRALIKLGCMQFTELEDSLTEEELNTLTREDTDLMKYRSDRDSVVSAVGLVDKYVPLKTPLLSSPPEVEMNVLLDDTGLSSCISLAGRINASEERIKHIGSEESRERATIESLAPWTDLDMPLDKNQTQRTAIILGTVPARIPLDEIETGLAEAAPEAELFLVSEDKAQQYTVLLCLKEQLQDAQEVLRRYGFTLSSVSGMEGTAKNCTAQAVKRLNRLAEEKQDCRDTIVNAQEYRSALKMAADRLNAKIAIAEAESRTFGTDSFVIMEGWIPAENEEQIDELLSRYNCAWESSDPVEAEFPEVPVKLKNNRFTNGLNMVTNMYALPLYGTVDPNPLMAPFFILFFGLMMADMGYGILMIIAAIVALKKMKPVDNTLSFVQLLLWGGIATFLMGTLTGGFFSDVPYQLVHAINPDSTWEGLPYLFSPVYNSEMVLYGSIALGALHLNTGLAVSFVQKVKAGNTADAIWEEGSLWVLLVGGILAVLGIGNIAGIPVLLIIAIIMLLFGAGRHEKGFGKITAAFSCIYNTATGWFGDLLSYSRIMALMLAGGVVGQVFNTVAVMPMNSSGINAGTVLAFIVIFLLGHAMNFALNLLGCYVHDLRLQCLEFFGKFYVDGGKPFTPLKFGGKYVRAKQN